MRDIGDFSIEETFQRKDNLISDIAPSNILNNCEICSVSLQSSVDYIDFKSIQTDKDVCIKWN